jgi:hypothetical protein
VGAVFGVLAGGYWGLKGSLRTACIVSVVFQCALYGLFGVLTLVEEPDTPCVVIIGIGFSAYLAGLALRWRVEPERRPKLLRWACTVAGIFLLSGAVWSLLTLANHNAAEYMFVVLAYAAFLAAPPVLLMGLVWTADGNNAGVSGREGGRRLERFK